MTTFIKLDIDGSIDWERIRIAKEMFGLRVVYSGCSIHKTRHGYHLRIYVENDIGDEELCMVQACMGDDYKRAILNWNRVHHGTGWNKKHWNVLFSMKFAVDPKNANSHELISQERELDNSIFFKKLKGISE